MYRDKDLLVMKDGAVYMALTEEEALALLGVRHAVLLDVDSEEEGDILYEEEIKEAFKNGKCVATYIGEQAPIKPEFFSEFCEMIASGTDKVTNAFDISREEAYNKLYNWTIDFQNETSFKPVEEGTFYDRIDEFISRKLLKQQFENFQWDESAVINLQGIMAQRPEADYSPGDFDRLRELAMEFTIYERTNKIKWNEDDNIDWESAICLFLKTKAQGKVWNGARVNS